jgi:hypothetical protein
MPDTKSAAPIDTPGRRVPNPNVHGPLPVLYIQGGERATPPYHDHDQVPDGFELTRALVADVNDTTRVALHYADGNETVNVRVLPDFDHELQGMSVSVDGQPGTITRGRATTSLYWECADRTYSVHDGLSAEEKLSIAESIECTAANGQEERGVP